ncbi:OmpP1/FadL family transporter [Methylotenera sp.]|uniref:OmpP1/FadL family transporter n=1 Tax=Methylotenera sp. TaxID=2051956 RepID=UPI002732E29D|nr:outer membrane protein transport protein [Methylotenera sp.]MDP3308307.1 outer membrane protein transport protein [Methylotenera sp.]MDP3819126.1 outer membrane protein transport protein [Methylotenera sp.]
MKYTQKILPFLVLLTTTEASATDGYFAHGYGVKSQAMGGVGIALPQDALAAAANPAGLGLVGDRVDFGVTWFRPQRETQLVDTAGGSKAFDGDYDANDTENFIIPEFGYNRQINPNVTFGVSVYGNGGMNTDYKKAVPLLGSTPPGVDLIQLFVAPTATWKMTPSNTIGVSLNLAYQRFEAKGLQNFTAPIGTPQQTSAAPNEVTNKGHDNSYGAGVHIGWIGQLNNAVTLGATYQSKTYMSKFDKYKGLFAEGGDFDIPSTYGVGIAVKATSQLTVAADVQRINYSDVKSVGNLSISNLFAGNLLGTSNGPGFGWRDVTAVKLGASYAYNDTLTLRAGYNHTTQPIRKSETLFNILAPGVVQDHLTLGATYVLPNKSELSFSYIHAFEESVNGSGSIPAAFGGGEANLNMYQDSIGIAYGWQL